MYSHAFVFYRYSYSFVLPSAVIIVIIIYKVDLFSARISGGSGAVRLLMAAAQPPRIELRFALREMVLAPGITYLFCPPAGEVISGNTVLPANFGAGECPGLEQSIDPTAGDLEDVTNLEDSEIVPVPLADGVGGGRIIIRGVGHGTPPFRFISIFHASLFFSSSEHLAMTMVAVVMANPIICD